jgi:hypothetical protein
LVEKGKVKMGYDRGVSLVRSLVEAVKQREIKKGQIADGIAERGGVVHVEISIILIRGVSDEVEVANNPPRDTNGEGDGGEISEERLGQGVVSGGVNIGDGNGIVGGDGGEVVSVKVERLQVSSEKQSGSQAVSTPSELPAASLHLKRDSRDGRNERALARSVEHSLVS